MGVAITFILIVLMTKPIRITTDEATQIDQLKALIMQEKLDILKRLSPIIEITSGLAYEELLDKYF